MRKFFSVLLILFLFPIWAVLSFALLPVGAAFQIFGTKARKKVCRLIYGLFGRAIFLMTLSKIKIINLGKIPRGEPFVLYTNHSSFFDVPIISGFIAPDASYVAKRMLIFWGPIGMWILLGGGILVERKKSKRELVQILKVISLIKKGQSFVVFPEGTRSRTGEIGEFHKGSLKVASKSGAKMIPVAIKGSRGILPRGEWFPRPANVVVTIGEPILPERAGSEPEEVTLELKNFYLENTK